MTFGAKRFPDKSVKGHKGMDVLCDLEEFVHDHRPHGPLTANATEPAWNGDLLTVACPCGVVSERWITPEEADRDLTSWSAIEVSRN